MDNRNIYNTQQPNYFTYSGYPATTAPMMRPEVPSYMIPQTTAAAVLKGRPVSSLEEARVSQIDLDGSVSFFPDLGNKKIYTKRINMDGTASLHTYILDEKPIETQNEYVTRTEIEELKATLDSIIEKLQVKPKVNTNQPINF